VYVGTTTLLLKVIIRLCLIARSKSQVCFRILYLCCSPYGCLIQQNYYISSTPPISNWYSHLLHLKEIKHKKLQVKLTIKKKVKWPCYRPSVAQRVGRGIALLFHDRGTRRGLVVSSTPRPHFTRGKELYCTWGWVGPRAGLDGRKISSPPGFDPGLSSP
jgi:hypothetical protein